MHTGGWRRGGETSCTPYKDFEKLPHKNAIKTTPPPTDFLTTPSTPLKRICQKPQGPPPPLDFQLLCIYDTNSVFFTNMLRLILLTKTRIKNYLQEDPC